MTTRSASRRRRKPRSAQLTFDDARKPTGQGGWRPRAGRPRGRKVTPHDTRPGFAAAHPQHVTLRVVAGLASLRRGKLQRTLEACIAAGHKPDFRVVHFAILSNHLHLVVEAEDAGRLARGMQGLAIRMARRCNRATGRRGKFFAGRYHARALRTPTEVRHVLRYVLLNARKHAADHGERLARGWFDPCSSAAWFHGWSTTLRAVEPWQRRRLAQASPVARPTTWLLTKGWRRGGGPLALDDSPGRAPDQFAGA